MSTKLDPTPTGAGPEPCSDCTRMGCGLAFGRLISLEFQGVPPYAPFHTITVSAHYLQHPSLGRVGRDDWWGFLDVYLTNGLDAVERIAHSRRMANASGRSIPPVHAPSGLVVPRSVGTGITAVEVIGLGPDELSPEGHGVRMEAWARSIMAR